MNPSLREEIFLASNRFTKSYHKTHELTNEILSIFEKRIDERLENYRKVLHADNDNEYTRGVLHCYEEIKKEMLSK